MKILTKALLLTGTISCLFACKQNNLTPDAGAGAINVTNAVIGGVTIDMYTGSGHNLTTNGNSISSDGYAFLALPGGQVQVNFGIPPAPATANSVATPATDYYSSTFTISAATNYSLFLTGASPSAIDHILIPEHYTRNYADSVCGVRFIHLATGTTPISVDIAGNANGSEVASLAYEAYSGFNQHPANNANQGYNFEFRDQATGTLLTTYTLPTPFFHNVTLAFAGTAGNYMVIQDNDF
jgi:hypothetical protein